MTRFNVLAAAALALALQAAPVAAAGEKEFKDWLISCDNLRNCSAFGLDTSLSGGSYLRIERGGAPNAPVRITLAVDADQGVTFTAKFNDPTLPGLPDNAIAGTKGEDDRRRVVLTERVSADTLIDSIRKAEKIVITRQDPPGAKSDPVESEVSMSGAVAALLWIDEQQKRLGTLTALIRKGDKPASAVPPQPKAPVIVAAKSATGKAPAKTDPALIKKGRALCGEEDDGSKLKETWALGNNQFLYAFNCPDSSGAYNYRYGFLVATGGNAATARAVSFKWPIKVGDLETDAGADETVVNPSFDEKTMTISAFNKGRGLGDCGTWEEWVWDGKSFKLAVLKMMGQCRLIQLQDWPTVYRAERK